MDVFSLFAKIGLDTSEYDKGLAGASQKTSSFGSKVKSFFTGVAKVGAAALGGATAAITAFGVSSVKTGAQFDSSMSQVAATMGTTVDNIQELRDFAMDMGAKTAFSATQAADALNYMALAGYNADEAMTALPNVLNLAAAGNIELAYASDMVTDAQSALGLSMEESAELVDKMAMASSKSNTSVAQLGEAILTVGGTAKNLAGGTTELATSLGILADNGIKGAEGGTTLRNVILSLAAPTDQAAELMESLGLEVYDAEGKMRPLNETFGDLDAILSTMTQGEQTEVLNKIFNKVDLKGVNALLANTGGRFDELSGYIDNATGSAEQMAAVQLDNLQGDVTLLKSAFEGAQIAISDKLTPALRDFVQFGTEGITRLSNAFQKGGLSGAMEELGDILGEALGKVTEKLPDAVEAGGKFLGALVQGISNSLPALGAAALEIVSSLASDLEEQLPTLIPQGLNAIFSFVEGLTSSETLGTLANAALGILNGLATGIVNSLHVIAEKGPEIISNLGQSISENLPGIVSKGGEILTSLIQGIAEALPALGVAAVEICAELLNGLWETDWESTGGDILQGIVDGITALYSSLQATSDAIVAIIWDKIQNTDWIALGKQFLNNFISGARMILGALGELAGNIVSTMWDRISNTDWLQLGKDVLNAIINGIQSLFAELGNTASNLVDKICDTLENTNWRAEGQNILNKIITGIRDKFTNLGNTAKDLVRKVTDTIINTDWLGVGRDIIYGIANGIGSAAGVLISAAQRVASSALTAIKNFFGIASPSKLMAKEVGRWLPPGIGEGMEQALPQLLGSIKNQMQTVMDTANSAMGGFGVPDVASVMAGSISHVSRSEAAAPGYAAGSVVVNQTIYAAEQSPIELAANTRAAFQRARWAIA